MLRLTFAATAAVAIVALAVHTAGTVWSYPIAVAAAAIGCLVVAREGSLR